MQWLKCWNNQSTGFVTIKKKKKIKIGLHQYVRHLSSLLKNLYWTYFRGNKLKLQRLLPALLCILVLSGQPSLKQFLSKQQKRCHSWGGFSQQLKVSSLATSARAGCQGWAEEGLLPVPICICMERGLGELSCVEMHFIAAVPTPWLLRGGFSTAWDN